MAAATASLELRNDTDANFRLWGNFISTGLAAGGWTLRYSNFASGTNWTDVTSPAQNAWGVTEIWESPAESGRAPFFVKLRYGSQNSATKGPALEWTVGWGYPGSGADLSGITTTAVSSQSGNSGASSTVRACTIAAGVGYIVINLGNGEASACGHLIVIERTLDPANSFEPTDEVAMWGQYYTNATQNVWQTVTPTTAYLQTLTPTGASLANVMWLYPQNESTWPNLRNGEVKLFGMTGHKEGDRTTAFRSILACRTIASGVPMLGAKENTVTGIQIYGNSHTFKIMNSPTNINTVGILPGVASAGSVGNFSLYVRHE